MKPPGSLISTVQTRAEWIIRMIFSVGNCIAANKSCHFRETRVQLLNNDLEQSLIIRITQDDATPTICNSFCNFLRLLESPHLYISSFDIYRCSVQ